MEFLHSIKRGLIARGLVLRAAFDGNAKFGEAMRLMLPGRFVSPEMLFRKQDILSDEVKQYFQLLPDGAALVFEHPFYPLDGNFWNLRNSFHDLIDEDGYQSKRFLKEDSIIIDAGASCGDFTVFAAQLVSKGMIYAFEPVPGAYGTLVKNMQPYSNVVSIPKGLGEKTMSAEMRWTDVGHGNAAVLDSPLLEGRGEYGGHVQVSIVAIDDFVKEQGLARVDFIKMDTEGYERSILLGARETMRTWKPVLSMSAYHHPDDRTEIPRIIHEINSSYTIELHQDKDELRFIAF